MDTMILVASIQALKVHGTSINNIPTLIQGPVETQLVKVRALLGPPHSSKGKEFKNQVPKLANTTT